jgi:hypothetical protein
MAVASSFRDEALEAVQAELRPAERAFGLFPAITVDDSGGGTAPAELWPVIIAAEHLIRRRRDRSASRGSLFPLSSRMIMALTDQRLMIWAARVNWRPGTFLGFVQRDRILQVTVPGTGSGWRTLLIHLANEPTVSIKVPSATASPLAAALSGATATNPESREPG